MEVDIQTLRVDRETVTVTARLCLKGQVNGIPIDDCLERSEVLASSGDALLFGKLGAAVVNEFSEMLETEVYGIPGSQHLERCLRRVLADSGRLPEMRRACRSVAEQRYSYGAMCEAYWKVFTDLTGART